MDGGAKNELFKLSPMRHPFDKQNQDKKIEFNQEKIEWLKSSSS